MFLRPCFLVVDYEFAGSISTRKLVLETAKFNVITAYSYPEARATLERFPNLQGIVVSAHADGKAEALLQYVEASHPAVKRILTGRKSGLNADVDLYVENYSPDALLKGLRTLFPDDAATADAIEQKLEEETLHGE